MKIVISKLVTTLTITITIRQIIVINNNDNNTNNDNARRRRSRKGREATPSGSVYGPGWSAPLVELCKY